MSAQLLSALRTAVDTLSRRVRNFMARAAIMQVIDSGNAQLAQIQIGVDEVISGVPVLSIYGLSANPVRGSDGIVLFGAGDRSNGVVIATGHQQQRVKNLKPGEVALWDGAGQSIMLTKEGITINGNGTLNLVVNGVPNVIINSSVEVTGNLTVGSGATGVLDTPTGAIATVVNGIIINISQED